MPRKRGQHQDKPGAGRHPDHRAEICPGEDNPQVAHEVGGTGIGHGYGRYAQVCGEPQPQHHGGNAQDNEQRLPGSPGNRARHRQHAHHDGKRCIDPERKKRL